MFGSSYERARLVLVHRSARFSAPLGSLDEPTCRVSFISFLLLKSLFPLFSKNRHACAGRPS
jgi:hypothetical protein